MYVESIVVQTCKRGQNYAVEVYSRGAHETEWTAAGHLKLGSIGARQDVEVKLRPELKLPPDDGARYFHVFTRPLRLEVSGCVYGWLGVCRRCC